MIRFALGFLTAVAIYNAPRYAKYMFRDLPETPKDWKPRMRAWKGGVEQ